MALTWEMDPQRFIKGAEYAYREWLRSPLIQRALGLSAEYSAAAAEVRFAAAMAQLRNASMVGAAGGLAVTAGIPLTVWVLAFVALGAPHAQAKKLVSDENFRSGYSQGFVTGLLRWEWGHVVSRFGKFEADFNPVDRSLGFVAANARNAGIRSGYLMAAMFPDPSRKDWLSKLRSFSPSTSAGRWDRNDQISYVIELAAAGRKNNLFR